MPTPSFGAPDEDLYRVRLQGKAHLGDGGELIDVDLWGWIPENWTLESQASYSPKLAGAISSAAQSIPFIGKFVGAAQTIASAGFGVAGLSQLLSLHTYEHSQPLSFSFPFYFYAEKDAAKDVTQKVSMLIQLQQPYRKNSDTDIFLYAPGPTYKDFLGGGGESLILTIGKLMRIPFIIVTQAQAQFETMATKNGDMILCKVDLSMQTAFVPTRSDIKDYFIVSGIDQQDAQATADNFRTKVTTGTAADRLISSTAQTLISGGSEVLASAGPYLDKVTAAYNSVKAARSNLLQDLNQGIAASKQGDTRT